MGRTLLILAGVLFAVGILAGFVPARATAVEYLVPNRDVSCGSFWIANRWSNDAGCDRVLTARFPWMAVPVGLSVPVGLLGGMLALLARDRERWSRNWLIGEGERPI